MSIFPNTTSDHDFHIAANKLCATCEECQKLPRWPVKKIGYLWQENGQWRSAGWEFDTSVPGTHAWLWQDLLDFAATQVEIMKAPVTDAE
jgi:hypothetical protein